MKKPADNKPSVVYLAASKSRVRKLLRRIVGPQFWMTYRLPFQQAIRISHPDDVAHPAGCVEILDHEMVHVEQFSHWWAAWLFPLLYAFFPLPFVFSGRWYIERRAYLHDIMVGRSTIEDAVQMLWRFYGWAWPRPYMRRWFKKHLSMPA